MEHDENLTKLVSVSISDALAAGLSPVYVRDLLNGQLSRSVAKRVMGRFALLTPEQLLQALEVYGEIIGQEEADEGGEERSQKQAPSKNVGRLAKAA